MVKIYTIANKRPDFIEIQYNTIKNNIKDAQYEYVVVNNANTNYTLKTAIESECDKLNIRTITAEHPAGINLDDPSKSVGSALSYLFKNHVIPEDKENIVVIIDSDMFLTKNINIKRFMGKNDIAYIPQYRPNIKYIWTGFFIINCANIDISNIDFSSGEINGHSVDVGGFTHYFLKENDPKTIYLEFWNIIDIEKTGVSRTYKTTLNGNAAVNFTLDNMNNVINFNFLERINYTDKLFEYETGSENYKKYYVDNILYAEKLYKSEEWKSKSDSILYFEYIKSANKKMDSSFILHYKSGSNYGDHSNEHYNEMKTEHIKGLLNL